MFDPFGDYDTAGYLRNLEGLKDPDEIKEQEHAFFEANLEDALALLKSAKGPLTYKHFLEVHGILFSEFYPWAGKDRQMLSVGNLVGKGSVQFEAADGCRRAIDWGLSVGNDVNAMRSKHGMVMGAFAWGHPFLDGNGRTMLLLHTELCARAGFSIDWRQAKKIDYLRNLTLELETPDKGLLDRYFQPLIRELMPRVDWVKHIKLLPGLDGTHESDDNIAYRDDDPVALKRYAEAKRSRDESARKPF